MSSRGQALIIVDDDDSGSEAGDQLPAKQAGGRSDLRTEVGAVFAVLGECEFRPLGTPSNLLFNGWSYKRRIGGSAVQNEIVFSKVRNSRAQRSGNTESEPRSCTMPSTSLGVGAACTTRALELEPAPHATRW